MAKLEPHLDNSGNVIVHDHPELHGKYRVFRKVFQNHLHANRDGSSRLSSQFYKPSTTGTCGLSVDLEQLLVQDGEDVDDFFKDGDCLGVVSFPVEEVRQNDFLVGYEPIPTDIYHGEVWQPQLKRNTFAKQIKEYASWFIPIEGVSL